MRERMCTVAWLVVFFVMITAGPSSADRLPVWIDTDPACGLEATDDVDDCWALLLALKSDAIAIRGVSTVFGNVSEERAYPVARQFLDRWVRSSGDPSPPIYRGAKEPVRKDDSDRSAAVLALADALEKEPLMIVALGPLTNIASLLHTRPDLHRRVSSIIAIAGSSEGERRFYFRDSGLLHFHDLNFLKDPWAFESVIETDVPLVLMPFEAAQKVRILPEDLAALTNAGEVEAWLAESSLGWMNFWRSRLGEDGFYPFDSLAMGYVIDPIHFACEPAKARVNFRRGRIKARDELIIDLDPETESRITYCRGVSPGFHNTLMATLSRKRPGQILDTGTQNAPGEAE